MLSKCRATISGGLKEIPLPDILQLLSSSKRTGYLKIVSTYDTAFILFKAGKINHAYFENKTHEPKEVLFILMTSSSGRFEFYKCLEENMEFKNTIDIGIPFLLMQAAQYEDEISVDIDMDFD
jgi:hypothetical protein